MININSMTTNLPMIGSSTPSQLTQPVNNKAMASNETVNISSQARMNLWADDIMHPMEPNQPSLPNQGEKLAQFVEVKKSIATYQAVSNLNNGKLSLTEAYILKNNEDVRQAFVAKEYKAHQENLIAAYKSGHESTLNLYA